MIDEKLPSWYSKSYPHRSLAEDFDVGYGDALLVGDIAAHRDLNPHHIAAVERLLVQLSPDLFVQMLQSAIYIRDSQGVEPWQ